jgi:hypothetical protein
MPKNRRGQRGERPRGSAGARRPLSKPRAPSARKSSAKDITKAIRVLGAGSVKPGSYKVVETPFLSASRRGFRALDHRLTKLRKTEPTRTLRYALEVRLPRPGRTKTGKRRWRKATLIQPFSNILPTARENRVLRERGRRAMLETRIKTDIFTHPDTKETPPGLKAAIYQGRMTKAEAHEVMRAFRDQSGVSFRVHIYREIP